MKLREIRKERNLKQEDVAKALNISRVAYTNIENGKRGIGQETLAALADFYGVSVDQLMGREEIKEDQPTAVDELAQVRELFSSLPADKQQQLLEYGRFLLQEQQRNP